MWKFVREWAIRHSNGFLGSRRSLENCITTPGSGFHTESDNLSLNSSSPAESTQRRSQRKSRLKSKRDVEPPSMVVQKPIHVRERRSPRLKQTNKDDSMARRSSRLSAKRGKKGIKRKRDVERQRKRKKKKKLWEVEKIVSQRIVKKQIKFEVKWVGYEETTWEPKTSLVDCDFLLKQFQEQQNS